MKTISIGRLNDALLNFYELVSMIKNLNDEEFVVLNNDGGMNYIQAVYLENDQTYMTEIRLCDDDDFVHYRRMDSHTDDVLVYFEDFYFNRMGWDSDFSQWQNVSGEF